MDYRLVIAGVLLFAAMELATGRVLNRQNTTRKDVFIEMTASLLLPAVIQAGILYAAP